MKCTALADNLKKALSVAERSVGKDQTLPILGSYLISADKNTITITSTNLEIGVQISIRGTINSNGSCVIPSRQLYSYISTLPKDEKITIETEGNNARIMAGSQETVFNGYPPEDYPPFPVVRSTRSISCGKKELLGAIKRTIFATAKTNIKPELASISILFERETLVIAATDSFRLSEERIKPTAFSPKLSKESFLLPAATAEELMHIIEYSDDGQVEFLIGKGEVRATVGDATIYSRLTDGTFPDYQQIIPHKFTTSFTINRLQFVSQVRRASIFANKLFGVSLTINPTEKKITTESKNPFGAHKGDVGADVHGEELTMVFNYHYILEGIESFDGEMVFIGLNSESQPLLMRPPKKDASLYIVMPMKGGA